MPNMLRYSSAVLLDTCLNGVDDTIAEKVMSDAILQCPFSFGSAQEQNAASMLRDLNLYNSLFKDHLSVSNTPMRQY